MRRGGMVAMSYRTGADKARRSNGTGRCVGATRSVSASMVHFNDQRHRTRGELERFFGLLCLALGETCRTGSILLPFNFFPNQWSC